MGFCALSNAAERLRDSLKTSTRRDLIAQVSLEHPSDDGTEVSFYKAILWGYAFWLEACQPTGRYILNIVRNTSPNDHKIASQAFSVVQNLRTAKAHNLDTTSKSDHYKLTQANIWIIQNGGEQRDWKACTVSLCRSLAEAINILADQWESITGSSEDASASAEQLLFYVDHEWPPHLFDRIIEDAAAQLMLTGLDPVAYRKKRLDEWKALTEMFAERDGAEAAVRRAIVQELTQKFGIPL